MGRKICIKNLLLLFSLLYTKVYFGEDISVEYQFKLEKFKGVSINLKLNKTPTQALTPPAEKKIGKSLTYILCNCSGRGKHKSGYIIFILFLKYFL